MLTCSKTAKSITYMPKEVKTVLETAPQDVSRDIIKIFSSVVIDFELIEGNMYLCIYNLSDEPYLEVQITPGKEIHGTNEQSTTDQLNIFKGIKYLAPHKCISVFLDETSLFFQHQNDLEIPFNIDYQNAAKQSFKYSFVHNLGIYKDLPSHSSAHRI
jgi:hypothetical protein